MRLNILILNIILIVTVSLTDAQVLHLSSKDDGINYLSKDPLDGYYDKVTSLEIAIQLKDTSLHRASRTEAITAYRRSYQNEVLEFTEKETKRLSEIMTPLLNKCRELNNHILPDTIRMILVDGTHYGTTTFFTRGHAIVTSREALRTMPEDIYSHVMLHELSHIMTRYNPELREDLYGHFGFYKIDQSILISREMYDRVFYNPDGVSLHYGIDLFMPDSIVVTFIPLITSNKNQFELESPGFFNYIHFQLYPLDKVDDVYFVRTPDKMENMDMQSIMKRFFEKISMNTQYIIHADEILADNFMYLFRSEEENAKLDHELLNNIRNTIENYKQ